MSTLRRELLLLFAGVTLIVLLAFLVPLGLLLDQAAQQRAISAATQRTLSLAPAVTADPLSAADQPGITVFLAGGKTFGTPAERTEAVELAALQGTIVVRTRHGVDVLVPAARPDGNAVIKATVGSAELHAGVRGTMTRLTLLSVGLFAFAVLLADRLARRMVSVTTALAAVTDRLGNGDLDARAAVDGPSELRRIATATNRLAVRIQELLLEQRREAAHLTHQLRTPLTALRLEADALRDTDERDRLADAAHRMTLAVDEVIRAAHRPAREGLHPATDLTDVVAQRLAFWAALAEETGRTVLARAPDGPVPVRLSTPDATTLLDVLLDNAFAHTPEHTTVTVTVQDGDDGVRLLVEDDGPGLTGGYPAAAAAAAAADPEMVGPASPAGQGPGSTGMGLRIAARIAADARGALTVDRPGSPIGFRVLVRLGRPD